MIYKYNLLFLILTVSSFSLFAQNSNHAGIRVGVLGGVNAAKIKSNSNQEHKSLITGKVGIMCEIPIFRDVSLQLEPGYVGKGVHLLEGPDPMEEPEARLKQSFIELPILAKYTFLDKISPYVLGGMALGFPLTTELEVQFPGLESVVQMKKVTESVELAAVFGGGIVFPVHFFYLFVDCRYNLGLTNLQKSGTVIVDIGGVQVPVEYDKDENGYKNRVVEITFGISIPL